MNERSLDDFRQHLLAADKSKRTVDQYVSVVRHFLKHVDETRVDRISEEMARAYFAKIKATATRRCQANVVSQYLHFTAARLPVPVKARGDKSPRARPPGKKEIALRQRWSVDKLIEQKRTDDDLIAKLARKVIDGYLLGQRQLKGDQNLDDLYRYVDECRELIESNLALFMALSAGGRNVHSKVDERIQGYENCTELGKRI
jgi:integrase-like protein